MFALPQPHYMPCSDCGASLARTERELHVCDRERQLDFVLFQLRAELEQFDEQLTEYLATPQGQFEAWYAAHRR
jgi:hypothetical protein